MKPKSQQKTMPLELQKILKQNPKALQTGKTLADRGYTTHLMFRSTDEADKITLPLCGSTEIGKIVTHHLDNVTCKVCIANLKAIEAVETLQEAKNILKGRVEVPSELSRIKHCMVVDTDTDGQELDTCCHTEYILGTSPALFWTNQQLYTGST